MTEREISEVRLVVKVWFVAGAVMGFILGCCFMSLLGALAHA